MAHHAPEPRRPALDGIRGIAVLAVIAFHYAAFVPSSMLGWPYRAILSFGWIGVDLFFVLSGFLITRILLQTKSSTTFLRRFWLRRALRILPPYLLMLGVVLALSAAFRDLDTYLPPTEYRLPFFLFVSNFAALPRAWNVNMLSHLWSLAVEEQFYLIWPLCALALSNRGLRMLAIALALSALTLRTRYVLAFGPAEAMCYLTVMRADALAIGALVATIPPDVSLRRASCAFGFALIGLAIFVALSTADPARSASYVWTFGVTILDLAFAALVYAVVVGTEGHRLVAMLASPRLVAIGRLSFGAYLFHVPLLWISHDVMIRRIPEWNHLPLVVAASIAIPAAATFCFAALSFAHVERPIMRLKRLVGDGTIRKTTRPVPMSASAG